MSSALEDRVRGVWGVKLGDLIFHHSFHALVQHGDGH